MTQDLTKSKYDPEFNLDLLLYLSSHNTSPSVLLGSRQIVTKTTFQRGSTCAASEEGRESNIGCDPLLARQREGNGSGKNSWPQPKSLKMPEDEAELINALSGGKFLRR